MMNALESRSSDPVEKANLSTSLAVRLEGVTKSYDAVPALKGVSLDVADGEFITLLGPSGCGKTTTLRLIGGFERPDSGAVYVAGKNVTYEPPFRRPVNTVFQQYALFPHLSIYNNIAYGLRHAGGPKAEIHRRVNQKMALMEIADLGDRKPSQLSGGQQQRVALARALVMEPKVLLLDEPLGALDYKLRKAMQLELRRVHREVGVTFIYVTHDQEEAMTMSDRIVVMNQGRIEQLGVPEEIYDNPATPFVAGFVGDTNLVNGVARECRAGRATVDLGVMGVVEGVCRYEVDAGDQVLVSVRPEDVRVTPSSESSIIVRDAMLIGSSIHLTMVAGDSTVSALVPRSAAVLPGTPVAVNLVGPRVCVYAREQA
jgi:spermidine/putrescine transport system ATP-binding protein